ncbi:aminotransferase class I/II-fold pyridoxal phosphate-dependent enzyme, partial [bacterium]|nr:aminotransferase class I/II-fold pyridoxal phosphate-dependent enzyme [bacterium]
SFGGVHSRQLKNHNDGTIHLNDIKNAIRKKDVHFPPSRLICLENTHNRCFGMPLETNYVNEVVDIAKNNDMSVHVDGARIFNAAVATGSTVADLTKNVDSVSFCLSKGLSAPSGSLLCGDKNFIHRARFNRKALGGGMRQAGILAAAGVVAIDIMSAKIIEDHRNAKALAFGIAKIDGINIETEKIKTNIIYFKLDHPKINSESLLDIMSKKNIRFFELGPNWFRLVTHSGISKENIDYVISEFDSFFSQA